MGASQSVKGRGLPMGKPVQRVLVSSSRICDRHHHQHHRQQRRHHHNNHQWCLVRQGLHETIWRMSLCERESTMCVTGWQSCSVKAELEWRFVTKKLVNLKVFSIYLPDSKEEMPVCHRQQEDYTGTEFTNTVLWRNFLMERYTRMFKDRIYCYQNISNYLKPNVALKFAIFNFNIRRNEVNCSENFSPTTS